HPHLHSFPTRRSSDLDNATYHYIDNLAIAIRQVGRIILDLIPKVYDQPRVMRILSEDGTERAIELDPNAKSAYEKQKQQDSVREDRKSTRLNSSHLGI